MHNITLVRPRKIEQVAALMLTVFKANPNAVMTRREIESVLDLSLDGFSEGSTRRRALNYLASQGHIRLKGDGLGGPEHYCLAK
jgi:hypothetical protein